jgi:hypothetical protein
MNDARQPAARSRRLLVAGGVAAAAILAGAVIASLVLDRQGTAEATPSPTPSSASSESTAPSDPPPSLAPTPPPSSAPSEPSALDLRWEQGAWDGDRAVGWVAYDAELDLWLAGGQRAIWTSTDRATWEAATIESAGCDDGAACDWSVSGVARLGDRLVAVGLISDRASDGTALASWMSDDGLTWSLTATGLPSGGQAPSVAESNGTVVLLAAGLTSPEAGTTQQITSDGTTWEAVAGEEGIKLYDVYGDEDGFVAVGEAVSYDGSAYQSRPIVRASSDGREWTTLTMGEPNTGVLAAVTRTSSGGYVAAGRDATGFIFTWRSGDADEPWTLERPGQAALPDGFDPGAGVELVTADAGVVLAGAGEAWISVDGLSWSPVTPPNDLMVLAMAAGADEIVAAGFPPTAMPATWSLWLGDVGPAS